MTLDQAIKILQDYYHSMLGVASPDVNQAIEIAIITMISLSTTLKEVSK